MAYNYCLLIQENRFSIHSFYPSDENDFHGSKRPLATWSLLFLTCFFEFDMNIDFSLLSVGGGLRVGFADFVVFEGVTVTHTVTACAVAMAALQMMMRWSSMRCEVIATLPS